MILKQSLSLYKALKTTQLKKKIVDLGDSSERNERNGGNKIRKTQRQPKDT